LLPHLHGLRAGAVQTAHALRTSIPGTRQQEQGNDAEAFSLA